jgi:hypothetical protein
MDRAALALVVSAPSALAVAVTGGVSGSGVNGKFEH